MQYEKEPQRKVESKYVTLAYNLPYLEGKSVEAEEENDADPYMQIFVRQISKLTLYSKSVTEYKVKLRRETR